MIDATINTYYIWLVHHFKPLIIICGRTFETSHLSYARQHSKAHGCMWTQVGNNGFHWWYCVKVCACSWWTSFCKSQVLENLISLLGRAREDSSFTLHCSWMSVVLDVEGILVLLLSPPLKVVEWFVALVFIRCVGRNLSLAKRSSANASLLIQEDILVCHVGFLLNILHGKKKSLQGPSFEGRNIRDQSSVWELSQV